MKVLTVVETLGTGGTERVAVTCAVGYASAGWDSAVLAYGGAGEREAELRNRRIPMFVGGRVKGLEQEAVRRAIAWNPDLVHIHRTGYPDKRSGAILTALASARRKFMETNVFARFDGTQAGGLIDVHIVLSGWCLWKYARWSRRANPRPIAAVIPNPVDTSRFYPPSPAERRMTRHRLSIPEGSFVVGRVGQPSASKWSPAILSEFTAAAKRLPNLYLVLVGSPADYLIRAKSLPPSIVERIRFVPLQKNDDALRLHYGAFDVFVHMSRIGETFGMVLCESMLCGTPVITLSTPLRDNSQVEVVGHGVGGLVVRHKRDVRRAVKRLANEPRHLEKMGVRGREQVLRRFDMRSVVAQLDGVGRALLESPDREVLGNMLEEALGANAVTTGRTGLPCDERVNAVCGWHQGILLRVVQTPEAYRGWRFLKARIAVK